VIAAREMSVRRKLVAVIEDEPDLCEMLTYALRREGFGVVAARDGVRGLDVVFETAPDLVLLDLMLPGLDGLEVCRRLKADPVTRGIPVIMVTAKAEESDVILGLGVGSDDYITKPYSPRELIARAKAVLRRTAGLDDDAPTSYRVEHDGVVFDLTRHEVTIDGELVEFTPTELRLAHFLASHPGRVFARDQLLSRVIGARAVVIERNIDVHVRAIRKKLGAHDDLIETVRGVGYRFKDRR
jgi:DNA-binding response OmpR family regulator